jgi:NAD(P)-dependent dehydrogenase (short-subunit alcohol dehydrogenase family)
MSQTSAERETTTTLRGDRALIVGGYGGLGSAVCARLAGQGADVAIAGRSKDKAAALAEQLGGRTTSHQVDVADRDSINRLVEEVTTASGGIDILVDCAGVLTTADAASFDEDEWRRIIETNLLGAFWMSQAAGRAMIAGEKGGRIVHLSSVRGSVGLAAGGFTAYGASKAGVNFLVKQLAAEWGKHQIRVNAVAPGFVRTSMPGGPEGEGFLQMISARTPLGRTAEVDEIADAVAFFAGPESRFVTGQVLHIDGGLSATQ